MAIRLVGLSGVADTKAEVLASVATFSANTIMHCIDTAETLRYNSGWTLLPNEIVSTVNNLSDLNNVGTARTNLGLGNVNNTSDANKPVSTATQSALDTKEPSLPSKVGASLKMLRVNTGETGYEYITLAGGGDMVLASTQTVSGLKTFLSAMFALRNVANTFSAFFTNTITANRTYTLKDADGTIAFTSDITGTNSGTNTGDAILSVVSVTATTYTVTQTSGHLILLVDTTTNAVTINLNTVVGNTVKVSIKKINTSANNVTIDGATTETIDDGLTAVLKVKDESITLITNQTKWFIL